MYCVGDDWQSIYRFTGSDVGYLSNFEKYFGYSKVLKIERTYRNSQELIDVVGPFIMANSNQIKKEMRSGKNEKIPARIWLHEANQSLETLEACIDEIAADFGEKTSVMLLVRNNGDAKFLDDAKGWVKGKHALEWEKHPGMLITLATVHSSKGSEADNVILLSAVNRLTGFPNKMADDPIMSLVLSDSDSYPYAEERRLFYVAMTRTRHRTYIMVNRAEPSEFIRDIYKKNNPHIKAYSREVRNTKNPICPRCQRGVLVLREREGNGQTFVGCSLYPQCQNTYNDISILQHPTTCPMCGGLMVVRTSTYGQFYGCSNYQHGCTYKTAIPKAE